VAEKQSITVEDLKRGAVLLAQRRQELSVEVAAVQARKAELQRTEAWTNVQDGEAIRKDAALEAQKAENALRADILELFSVDGNKHPAPKLDVKVRTELAIRDEGEALAYCIENLRSALTVDLGILESVLKALPDEKRPAWALIVDVPVASIGQDLSSYLPEVAE